MTAITINPKTLARGLRIGTYRETEAGTEKRCTRCGEFWPVDDEFYAPQKDRGVYRASSMCRACFIEKYNRGAGMAARKGAK